jgi:hypothetical protein
MVVEPPAPDQDGVIAWWTLRHATSFRRDTIQAFQVDGVPYVSDDLGPAGNYTVEEMRERCLAGLAACAKAERLAAEQRSPEYPLSTT